MAKDAIPKKFGSALSSNFRWSFLVIGSLLVTAGLTGRSAANATAYQFTQIDVPGAMNTWANGINDAGQIVGVSSGPFLYNSGHGFLYTGGTFTQIDAGAAYTTPTDINNEGQIVGVFADSPGGIGHGFLYTHGSFTELNVPGAGFGTIATGINDAGQIVGGFQSAPVGTLDAFLYTGGTFTLIDPPGASYASAQGINDAGQIVGWSNKGGGASLMPFLYAGGSFTRIDVPGAVGTLPFDINDKGQIVGTLISDGKTRGFVDTGGSIAQIDVPGAASTHAEGINNAGQIVGVFVDKNGREHGFLATPAGNASGDPWFTTFNGLRYQFQQPGEFVLSRSIVAGDPFDVEIRDRPWREGATGNIISAAAAELCGHRATFDVDRANAGGGFFWVDGHPSSLSLGHPALSLGGCTIEELSTRDYQLLWDTGEMVDVTIRGPELSVSSWYSPFVGPGSVEGLLTTSADPDQWRISDPTSLFDDPPALLDAAAAAAVPEPATLILLGAALAGFGVWVFARYLSSPADRSVVGNEEMIFAQDIAENPQIEPTRISRTASTVCTVEALNRSINSLAPLAGRGPG